MTPNTWTWIDYSDGNTSTRVTLSNLAAGAHTLTLLGSATGVTLDDIVFTTDPSCVPTGSGSNCNASSTTSASVAASISPSPGAAATAATGKQGANGLACTSGYVMTAGKCKPRGLNPLAVAGGTGLVLVLGGAAGWYWWRKRLAGASGL